MRHLKKTKKFKRTEEERRRLWTDLSRGLIINEKIVTFTARAKWFRPKFEKVTTLIINAGKDTQLAFRIARQYFDEATARKLITDLAPKLHSRKGGYTSQIKLHSDFSSHDKSLVRLLLDEVTKKTNTSKDIQTDKTPKTKNSKKAETK